MELKRARWGNSQRKLAAGVTRVGGGGFLWIRQKPVGGSLGIYREREHAKTSKRIAVIYGIALNTDVGKMGGVMDMRS